MENQSKNGNIIAIITMMFLYAMISFVRIWLLLSELFGKMYSLTAEVLT